MIDDSIYSNIISNIQKSLGNHSCWIIDLPIADNINISKRNFLDGSGYTKLPIQPSKKWFH